MAVSGRVPPLPARLRASEWMLVGYAAFVSGLGTVRLGHQPAIAWVLLANGLIVLLVLLAAREPMGRLGRTMREVYPIILLSAMYPALDILNNFGGVTVHDRAVQRWELVLFGTEPSRVWWQHAPSVFWSTVLHAAYLAYYPIIVAPILVFLLAGRDHAARRAVRWILSTFLVCYLAFLAFPVAGPYYEFPRPAAWFVANPAARLVYATLARGSAYGAAFPSSHVAAAVVATAAAFAGSRTLGWILLIPTVLLTVGVVYCQMHYVVDALAGLALGGVVVGLWVHAERNDRGRGAPRWDSPAS